MSVLKTYGADTASFKPSKTYCLHNNRIEGMVNGVDAVRQSADLILGIERFEHLIYSWDYGNELKDFIGRDKGYVKGDIERRIRESLLEDDRIESVSDFKLSFQGEAALISLRIHCIFGEFDIERSVPIGK